VGGPDCGHAGQTRDTGDQVLQLASEVRPACGAEPLFLEPDMNSRKLVPNYISSVKTVGKLAVVGKKILYIWCHQCCK
jgi:hypothetical protein